MPCACPGSSVTGPIAWVTCGWPPLPDAVKNVGVSEDDWAQAKKIWNCAEIQLLVAHIILALVLVAILVPVTITTGLYSLWSIMSAVNLARLVTYWTIPTAVEKMKNQIFAKKNIDVKWVQTTCLSYGLVFTSSGDATQIP